MPADHTNSSGDGNGWHGADEEEAELCAGAELVEAPQCVADANGLSKCGAGTGLPHLSSAEQPEHRFEARQRKTQVTYGEKHSPDEHDSLSLPGPGTVH